MGQLTRTQLVGRILTAERGEQVEVTRRTTRDCERRTRSCAAGEAILLAET